MRSKKTLITTLSAATLLLTLSMQTVSAAGYLSTAHTGSTSAISVLNATAKFGNGYLVAAGTNGKFQILDPFGKIGMFATTWSHGSFEVKAAIRLTNGTILLGSGFTLRYGKWSSGANGILSAIQLYNNNIMLVGWYGRHEIWDINGVPQRTGIFSTLAHVYEVEHFLTPSGIENVIAFGHSGNYESLDTNAMTFATGTASTTQGRAITPLLSGNLFFGGATGKFDVKNQQGATLSSGTWTSGSTYHIRDSLLLDNGNLFVVGTAGRWEVMTEF